MANTLSTSQLKRKHEGAESQRKKKVKTQGKSKAGHSEREDAVKSDAATIPVTSASKEQERITGTLSNDTDIDATISKSTKKKSKVTKPEQKLADKAAVSAPKGSSDFNDAKAVSVKGQDQSSSKKTKRRKRQGTNVEEDVEPAKIDQGTDGETIADSPMPLALSTLKERQRTKRVSQSWAVSAPLGGWFLPNDAIFSQDEKSLIVANAGALQVYSTDNSLLVRELQAHSKPNNRFLSAYALSSNPDHVYVATHTGLITLWDWNSGNKVGRWDIGNNIKQTVVIQQPESDLDLVYTHEAGNRHIINVHALRTKAQSAQTDLKQILKTKSTILHFQVLLRGKIVVVATNESIIIGKRAKLQKTALQDFEYVWHEVRTSMRTTTLDAFVRSPESSSKGKQSSRDQREQLDVAIGNDEGVIYIFEDMLSSFVDVEKNLKEAGKARTHADVESFKPKRLHWHRDAVGAVKWSRDGNYLISGGDETVLVIWQLSTGKQQHLPHLTAAIENITISPSGSSYAVTLANNSIIVLSTSELQPKTNIVGVQSRRVNFWQMPQPTGLTEFNYDVFGHIPMAINPNNGNQVLYTVPSSQPRHLHGLRIPPEPYMQTFDLSTQRPITRQALTRNNATDPNMGPEGKRIHEPSVKFLKFSNDGKWLATVDEWIPPQRDLGYLDEGIPDFNEEEQTYRREVYLKFWQWDEKISQWTLASRVDSPHFFEDVGASARVLDLVTDPSKSGFATIGEDRTVRTWRPKTRIRDGTMVRGAENGLVNWSLDQRTELTSSLDTLDTTTGGQEPQLPFTARLAFSGDGSVLAAGISWVSEDDSGVVHIIDANTGGTRRSISEVDVGVLACLGILGRHLVVVGDTIVVWDLVADEIVHCIPLEVLGVYDIFDKTSILHLDVNEDDGTFAVAYPRFETDEATKFAATRRPKKASTKVSVFNAYQSFPLWSTTLPDVILSLAAARGTQGYVVLDSSSSLRALRPKRDASQLPTPPPEVLPKLLADATQIEDDEEGDTSSAALGDSIEVDDLLLTSENDKPVVRPEQLQQIFDVAPSHALPPVKDLLQAIVGLYARRPRTVKTV